MRQIVAIGGGGFLMEASPSPIDKYLRNLIGKSTPRICFIPTPSGDAEEHLEKFYSAYTEKECVPSHLTFFRKPRSRSLTLPEYADQLLAQDLIFVGGGNTRSALAVWREWGLDSVLAQAWSKGIILAGMSAGALCWFEVGVSDSFGDGTHRLLPGIGLLPGACAVHYNAFSGAQTALHKAVSEGTVSGGVAVDDGAAVVFREHAVEHVISWQEGCSAYKVSYAAGHIAEEVYACERV